MRLLFQIAASYLLLSYGIVKWYFLYLLFLAPNVYGLLKGIMWLFSLEIAHLNLHIFQTESDEEEDEDSKKAKKRKLDEFKSPKDERKVSFSSS